MPLTEPTTAPLGVAGFAGDFSGVRRFADMHPEPGGHYSAHLEPGAPANDIRGFYRKYR